ncbi:MAG: hypothetical protein AVDCRST_MAG56-5514 [uncultured Cytophagales bacterium]|uniref:Uncharacterized protein n=1 Tax=uncultured Cytophagales bacterium TaxID=158755 RepID=A0A6J4KEX1_9SPHI|nr:MAG: hypothetical protein AVDCRST_MAG56-5514 [uncultured Cytophagales bacterium]
MPRNKEPESANAVGDEHIGIRGPANRVGARRFLAARILRGVRGAARHGRGYLNSQATIQERIAPVIHPTIFHLHFTPMPRAKKTSLILETANTRLAGVKSIDAKLDLGNGLSVAEYQAAIDAVRVALEAYNTVLSLVDEKQNEVIAKEKRLRDLHERMLMGVAARHGKDSIEYEKAGGTRKSERKKKAKAGTRSVTNI